MAQEFWEDWDECVVKQDAMTVPSAQAGVGWTWHQALQRTLWREKEDSKMAWWALANIFQILYTDPNPSEHSKRAAGATAPT